MKNTKLIPLVNETPKPMSFNARKFQFALEKGIRLNYFFKFNQHNFPRRPCISINWKQVMFSVKDKKELDLLCYCHKIWILSNLDFIPYII